MQVTILWKFCLHLRLASCLIFFSRQCCHSKFLLAFAGEIGYHGSTDFPLAGFRLGFYPFALVGVADRGLLSRRRADKKAGRRGLLGVGVVQVGVFGLERLGIKAAGIDVLP